MTERVILEHFAEYVVNCAWQIPLLAAGACLLVKVVRPGILAQHLLWLSVLAMAILLPGRGVDVRSIAGRSLTVKALAPPVVARAIRQDGVAEPLAERRELPKGKYVEAVREGSPPPPVGGRTLVLSSTATLWLVSFYVLAICIGGVRLARGLLATRRLLRSSREAVLAPRTMHVLEEASRGLKVAIPKMRESGEIDGPVILGAMRPVMVLPLRFEAHAEEEVRAALLHELAHVRRRDYLVNLMCQVAALPVVWHPAVYAIQQRIRRTREMLCDAIAAEAMNSGAAYARCLVSLARQMLREADAGSRTQAVGLFEQNTMEERVMKLTENPTGATHTMNGRTKVLRGLCGCAAMIAVMGAAATFHITPTFAAAEGSLQSAAVPAPAPSAAAKAKPSAQVAASDEAKQSEDRSVMIPRGNHGTVAAGKGNYVHRWKSASGEPFVVINDDANEPGVEEQQRVERQLADSRKAIDEANKQFNNPAFQQQMAEIRKNLNSAEMKAQIEAANKMANDPAMKQHMEEMQKQLSHLDMHLDAMPELKKFNDPEWQKQFAELKMNPPDFKFDLDLEKQMVIASSGMAKSMKWNEGQMARMQKEIESGELQRKVDEATRLLEEVNKKMEAMQAK